MRILINNKLKENLINIRNFFIKTKYANKIDLKLIWQSLIHSCFSYKVTLKSNTWKTVVSMSPVFYSVLDNVRKLLH